MIRSARLLPVISVLAALLIACSTAPSIPSVQEGSVTGAAAPAPQRAANQVIRVAQTGIPASVSPEVSNSNIAFYSTIYDTPVTFGKNFEVIPQVAERWEFSGMTWRFFLRKDVEFSDGTPLTAEDLAFSLNNIAERSLPQRSVLATLKSARAINPYTAEVETNVPDSSVLNAMPWVFILPKAYYERVGQKAFATQAIGSGPYEVAEFVPSDHATFRKRAAQHPFRQPIPTEIQFRTVPELSATVAGLQTGEIDLTTLVVFSADQLDQLEKSGVKLELLMDRNVMPIMAQPNNEDRHTPLTDKRVRQALLYAIDRDALANNLYKGRAIPVGQLTSPSSPFFNSDVKPYPYDPKKAKELLAAAGYPNGFTLPTGIDFTPFSVNPQLMVALQGYLRDVGVEAPLNSYEVATFLDRYYGRNGQTRGEILVTSGGDTNGMASAFRGLYECDRARETILWCNREFLRLFDLALAEPNAQKRVDYLRQAHRAFVEDVPILWLIVTPSVIAHGPKIGGVEFSTQLVHRFDSVYREQ